VHKASAGKQRVVLDADFRAAPPACCTNDSETVPPEPGAKFAQTLPYASPEWRRTYNALRNATEGMNGFLKVTVHEGLGQSDRRRVHGVAAQSVLVAFQIMAGNVRKIRSFEERRAAEAGTLRHLPRRRRRTTRSLEEWHPDVRGQAPVDDSLLQTWLDSPPAVPQSDDHGPDAPGHGSPDLLGRLIHRIALGSGYGSPEVRGSSGPDGSLPGFVDANR